MVDRRKNEDLHIPVTFAHDNVVTKGPCRIDSSYPIDRVNFWVILYPRTLYVMLRNGSEWSIPSEPHGGG